MPKIILANRGGEECTINAASGGSLMEAIRDNGFDEVPTLCGGCCSCATCRVHVDPAFVGMLEPMSEDETDLQACSSLCREAQAGVGRETIWIQVQESI